MQVRKHMPTFSHTQALPVKLKREVRITNNRAYVDGWKCHWHNLNFLKSHTATAVSLFGHFRTQSPRAHQPYSQHTLPPEPFGRWCNSCVAPRHFIGYRTKCSESRFRIRKSVCSSPFTIMWRMDVSGV